MANKYIALPPEVEASYAAIIDNILAVSDLNTISAKRIRKGLQERLDYDISHQKVHSNSAVDTWIGFLGLMYP